VSRDFRVRVLHNGNVVRHRLVDGEGYCKLDEWVELLRPFTDAGDRGLSAAAALVRPPPIIAAAELPPALPFWAKMQKICEKNRRGGTVVDYRPKRFQGSSRSRNNNNIATTTQVAEQGALSAFGSPIGLDGREQTTFEVEGTPSPLRGSRGPMGEQSLNEWV
jgi:hypothetical protein